MPPVDRLSDSAPKPLKPRHSNRDGQNDEDQEEFEPRCHRELILAVTAEPKPCYTFLMPKRSSKPPEDENKAAFRVTSVVTGAQPPERTKNPAAVQLGRLGGLKGGKARAAKLSPRKRKDIARKAALTRWSTARKAIK